LRKEYDTGHVVEAPVDAGRRNAKREIIDVEAFAEQRLREEAVAAAKRHADEVKKTHHKWTASDIFREQLLRDRPEMKGLKRKQFLAVASAAYKTVNKKPYANLAKMRNVEEENAMLLRDALDMFPRKKARHA
jgi:hypothetical protein